MNSTSPKLLFRAHLVFELAVRVGTIGAVGYERARLVNSEVFAAFGSEGQPRVLVEFDVKVLWGGACSRRVEVVANSPVLATLVENGELAVCTFEAVHVWERLVDFNEPRFHGSGKASSGSECNSWSVNDGELEDGLGVSGGFVSLCFQVAVHLLSQVLAVACLEGNVVDAGFAGELNVERGVGTELEGVDVDAIFASVSRLGVWASVEVLGLSVFASHGKAHQLELVSAKRLHLENFLVCGGTLLVGRRFDATLDRDVLAVDGLQGDLWVGVPHLEGFVVRPCRLGGLAETLGAEASEVLVAVDGLERDSTTVNLEDKVRAGVAVVGNQCAGGSQIHAVCALDTVRAVFRVEDDRDDGVRTPCNNFVCSETLAIVWQVNESLSLDVVECDHRVLGEVHTPETVFRNLLDECSEAFSGSAEVESVLVGLDGPSAVFLCLDDELVVGSSFVGVGGDLAVNVNTKVCAQVSSESDNIGAFIRFEGKDLLLLQRPGDAVKLAAEGFTCEVRSSVVDETVVVRKNIDWECNCSREFVYT